MDKVKIGKFIYELRKENQLTQAEFAARLHVTAQAVSKWENGRGIPDISILQAISQEFHVDISSILEGEKKEEPKKDKRLLYVALALIGCILIGICLFFCFNEEVRNYFEFSSLNSTNESFDIKGIAAYSKDQKSIYISSIKYVDDEDKEVLYTAIECSLFEEHNNIETKLSTFGSIDEILYEDGRNLSELVSLVEFKVDNFDDDCDTIEDNQLYISIELRKIDDEVVMYKIPLELGESCRK